LRVKLTSEQFSSASEHHREIILIQSRCDQHGCTSLVQMDVEPTEREEPSTMEHKEREEPSTMEHKEREEPSTMEHKEREEPSTMEHTEVY
jgi:hypothetical protein